MTQEINKSEQGCSPTPEEWNQIRDHILALSQKLANLEFERLEKEPEPNSFMAELMDHQPEPDFSLDADQIRARKKAANCQHANINTIGTSHCEDCGMDYGR